MDSVTTLRSPAAVAECRRLAELLQLDAVGVVRTVEGRRRVAWWVAPGTDVPPLDRILEGSAAGWIVCPRADDLVFAHLTEDSSVRSVAALSAMLGTLAAAQVPESGDLGSVAVDDALAQERARLAYAIHDGLTQVVTASILELEWHARRAEVAPDEAVEALVAAAAELRKALDEIRALLAGLSGTTGAETSQPFEELMRGVLERWHLPATWSVEGDLNGVPAQLLEVASSVIRESVANAAKHSAAQDVAVTVHASRSAVEVRIDDRGRGFAPDGTDGNGADRARGQANGTGGHLGLEIMRRRVAEVHGTLDVESSPGKGTRVVARLPVSDQGAKS